MFLVTPPFSALDHEVVITTGFQLRLLVYIYFFFPSFLFHFFPLFPTGLSLETPVLMKSNKMKMGKLLHGSEHLRGPWLTSFQ